ncbi:MAG: HAD family hydrolase [Ruminococcus sp.]|nr:HAD family hydrolase [Ruminococcus sp.]
MRYKAVVFDFDLTLADSSKAIIECYKHTLTKFGYPVPEDSVIFGTIGKTLADSFDILTGIPNNPQQQELRTEYVKKADTCMAAGTVFYPDSIALLQILQNAGVKTAIVSSKMKYRIEETFMLHTGCVPVDEIIGLSDMPSPKPAPDGIYQASMLLNVPPADILYVGDSLIDAETARNAGVDFAAVLTGPNSREDFEKLPHICIANSLLEIFTSINNNE